jgi:hypothetical protein
MKGPLCCGRRRNILESREASITSLPPAPKKVGLSYSTYEASQKRFSGLKPQSFDDRFGDLFDGIPDWAGQRQETDA